jgi:ubiquinone/menaquinone biosynthesis C-methylase UbiE
MSLTEQNLREKEFHNKLHSNNAGRFENFFYKAISNAWEDFFNYLKLNAENSVILDYGCGIGPIMAKVIKFNPEKIIGIDISNVSISNAKKKVGGLTNKIELLVGNCEKTNFNNDTFDIVYGLGIIHHLETRKCINEIFRILKHNGVLLFIEPLGTNPIINFYRKLTPKSRSKDEHPLIEKDFRLIRENFNEVKLKYYGFLTLIFFPFYKSNTKSFFFKLLISLDQLLFRLKIFRLFAWSVLIIAKKN